MVKFNILELLKKNHKTKYWLCQQMAMTSRNLNRLIDGKTTSVSFKYIEEFCRHLNCTSGELITVVTEEE